MKNTHAVPGAAVCLLLLFAARGVAPCAAQPAAEAEAETPAVRAAEYVFEVEAGGSTSRLVIREETRNGERTYVSKTGDLEQFYRYDGQNRLAEWRFSMPGKNTDFTAKREGGNVVVRGTLRGDTVEKTIRSGAEPWFQNSEFGLLPFVRAPEKTIDFFAVEPEGLKRVVFRARKIEGETVEWGGRSVETIRVKAHLQGPLSLVWSATYWYAVPGLTFIRYRASGGGGTPKTDIRLLESGGQ